MRIILDHPDEIKVYDVYMKKLQPRQLLDKLLLINPKVNKYIIDINLQSKENNVEKYIYIPMCFEFAKDEVLESIENEYIIGYKPIFDDLEKARNTIPEDEFHIYAILKESYNE